MNPIPARRRLLIAAARAATGAALYAGVPAMRRGIAPAKLKTLFTRALRKAAYASISSARRAPVRCTRSARMACATDECV